MTETLPLAQVKATLSEVVENVISQQDRVTITRRGKPVAVILSVEDLRGLEETLSILSDETELAQVREGIRDAEAGRLVPLDQVMAERLATHVDR